MGCHPLATLSANINRCHGLSLLCHALHEINISLGQLSNYVAMQSVELCLRIFNIRILPWAMPLHHCMGNLLTLLYCSYESFYWSMIYNKCQFPMRLVHLFSCPKCTRFSKKNQLATNCEPWYQMRWRLFSASNYGHFIVIRYWPSFSRFCVLLYAHMCIVRLHLFVWVEIDIYCRGWCWYHGTKQIMNKHKYNAISGDHLKVNQIE